MRRYCTLLPSVCKQFAGNIVRAVPNDHASGGGGLRQLITSWYSDERPGHTGEADRLYVWSMVENESDARLGLKR